MRSYKLTENFRDQLFNFLLGPLKDLRQLAREALDLRKKYKSKSTGCTVNGFLMLRKMYSFQNIERKQDKLLRRDWSSQ